MKKNTIYILIGAMTLALLGVIWLQVSHVQKAMRVYEKNFDMLVNNTLERVARQLAQEPDRREWIKVAREVNVSPVDSSLASPTTGLNYPLPLDETAVMLPRARVRIRDSVSFVSEREAVVPADSLPLGNARISYLLASSDINHPDSMPRQLVSSQMGGEPGLLPLLNTRENRMPGSVYVPWMGDSVRIDSVIRNSLGQVGIQQAFRFQIQGLYSAMISGNRPETYQVPIYDQAMEESGTLSVRFPERDLISWQQVVEEAGLSALFVLVILGCFGYSIHIILRQKKLSEMKNDFINNMTHELKTPIATISLAADAIQNPRIQADPEGVVRYTKIIKEENNRMNRQVERVLLAAQQTRGELKLRKIPLDLHALINKAAEHTRLQVAERGGKLQLDLQARKPEIQGDKVHLSNVIYNLLDNANKYSPDAPEITIRTYNQRGQLIIAVEDRGKGINKADQQRIFQRFYRVSTGDLHETKGFGLGLSYVKDITEAHGGQIRLQSAPGRGSTFELWLPQEISE